MDIDIDFPTSFNPLDVFNQAVQASQVNNKKLTKHPAGIYLQTIPKDPITGLSAIPYKQAEEFGYFKVDCLHLSAMDQFVNHIETKQQLRTLADHDPDCCLLYTSPSPRDRTRSRMPSSA